MFKKIILIIILLFTIFNTGYAENNEENFEYLYFDLNNLNGNNETYIVSFGMNFPTKENYILEMNLIHNETLHKNICQDNIKFDIGSRFSKLTYNVPKLGDGSYTFETYLYDENKNLIKKLINKEFIFQNQTSTMNFDIKENQTIITIEIKSNKPVIITNEIPKEVIESLTKKNKDSLIQSNIPYKILKEDPLIAWNIEEPPAKINYTINKKISIEDQEKFKLEIKEDSSFKALKYIIFSIILIIIGIVLKPAFTKKKK